MYKVAPLNNTFMLASLMGIIVSGFYIYKENAPWGFAFLLIFVIMLIASILSMTYAPVEEREVLQVDEKRKKK